VTESFAQYTCAGKACFPDMGIAREIALARKKGGHKRKGGKPGMAYRCKECGGIHIGRPWTRKRSMKAW
jgi:hypothetical protein